MSCCATPHKGAYPISANFICLCFSVLSLFVSYLSCSFCNSSVYQKVCFTAFVKGYGSEKGRGIPLPFSVFLVPFVTSQKERPFLFPLEKEHSSFLLERNKFFSTPETEVFMLFFPYRKANTPFAGCGKSTTVSQGGKVAQQCQIWEEGGRSHFMGKSSF